MVCSGRISMHNACNSSRWNPQIDQICSLFEPCQVCQYTCQVCRYTRRSWNTQQSVPRLGLCDWHTEDRSVPVVVPWCDLTMNCALSVRPSLSADLSPCTGCYKLILLTLYVTVVLQQQCDNATYTHFILLLLWQTRYSKYSGHRCYQRSQTAATCRRVTSPYYYWCVVDRHRRETDPENCWGTSCRSADRRHTRPRRRRTCHSSRTAFGHSLHPPSVPAASTPTSFSCII